MTGLFRSKSCGGSLRPCSASLFHSSFPNQNQQQSQEEESDYSYYHNNPITTPFISPPDQPPLPTQSNNNITILALLLAALRKSLVTCTVDDSEDVSSSTSSLDIGSPTDVQHVSHVTFDRFNGFRGLPLEFQPDVSRKVPSASASVFGVSAGSMQCSYDERGNSVPTILVMMQKRLYSGGGLQAEGIFRINAENGQEEDVRKHLNRGFLPHGIDVHCLAGLIKAWFRELPTGVLDSLTPEQVMHCNTEEECSRLVNSLPETQAALLDWAINLMADVVKYQQQNKMNARNIAMVFAPNMTQMADPLTALIHAVQVMNLLKTLVIKTLREREGSSTENEDKFWSFSRNNVSDNNSSPVYQSKEEDEDEEEEEEEEEEGIFERLSFTKGVRRLCKHPVFQFQFQFQFQLSKPFKKNRNAIIS